MLPPFYIESNDRPQIRTPNAAERFVKRLGLSACGFEFFVRRKNKIFRHSFTIAKNVPEASFILEIFNLFPLIFVK